MYNLAKDPGETFDLKAVKPTLFAEMIRHYSEYTTEFGVLEMGINYEPLLEIQNKMVEQIRQSTRPWLIGFVILLIGWRIGRRLKW
jgi:hypothetical protein